MATTPLILRGNLKIDTASPAVADVSDAVFRFVIAGDADEIEIPATLSTPKTSRKGGVKYTITLDFLSNDTAVTELFQVLWANLTNDAAAPLNFLGTLRDGSISATNPSWSGSFYVTHAAIGGDAEGLSTDSATFTLTGAPVQATS